MSAYLNMKKRKNIKLTLTQEEKNKLRAKKYKIRDLLDLSVEEIEEVLEIPMNRAKEIYGLGEFQKVPSIGIKFAEDLVFLGYYSLQELKNQDGAKLIDAYEIKKGYQVDACVEDQCRLVVHFANDPDSTKNWWDFTDERKKYRAEHGYPDNRPRKHWTNP